MYYSIIEATGTGDTITVAVPPYISRDHIKVFVDFLPTEAYEWVNAQTISLVAAANRKVRVLRQTSPSVRLSDYKDGLPLGADPLNIDSLQAFYLAQEALDRALEASANTTGNPSVGGVELTTAGIKALLAGQIAPSELELSLRNIIGLITADSLAAGSPAWRVAQEELARISAINAEQTARQAALAAEAVNRQAAITVEKTERQAADDSLASQITTLTSSLNGNIAALQIEQTARTSADTALANQVTTLVANLGTATSAITAEQTARSNADNALASSIESIRVALEGEDASLSARINTEVTARVNADSALATQISTLDAAYKGADTTLQANINAVDLARTNATNALASRVSLVEGRVDLSGGETVKGLIATETTARANADTANANAITSVQSSITGPGGVIPRLATVETSATTSATKLGTVESNYTIKVQARGDGKQAIAGIGLTATSGTTTPTQSEMVFLADKFTFVPSQSDINAVPQPLLVGGLVNGVNTVVIPPSRIGDRLVEARMIVDGGIEARHMTITGGYGTNRWPDAFYAEPQSWDADAPWTSRKPTRVAADIGFTMRSPTGQDAAARGAYRVPVTVGRRYRVSCRMRQSGGANGGSYLRIDAGTARTGSYGERTFGVENVYPGTSWTPYAGEWVADAPWAAPMVLLNHLANTGWVEATDFRIEEMLDSSLVVQGGISADRIDSRGLSIRDGAGNIILAAGSPLAASNINPASNWLNGNITLGSDGRLNGIGTGSGTSVANDLTTGGVRRIPHPGGGVLNSDLPTQNGAIWIVLPVGWNYSMLRFDLEVFEYLTGAVQTYSIAGYNYDEGNGSQYWVNASATYTGDPARVRRVTFGKDTATGRPMIGIGLFVGSWSYPKVKISNVVVGHSGHTDPAWGNNWSMTWETSRGYTEHSAIANPRPGGAMSGVDVVDGSNVGGLVATSAGMFNNQIGINASGQFYGGGAGTGIPVSNNQIQIGNDGRVQGIGYGAGTVVDNAKAAGDNLIPDPQFLSPSFWLGGWGGDNAYTSFGAINAERWEGHYAGSPGVALRLMAGGNGDLSGGAIMVTRGTYRLRIRVFKDSGITGTAWVGLHVPGQAWWSPVPETSVVVWNLAAIPSTTWTDYTSTIFVPGIESFRMQPRIRNLLGGSGSLFFTMELARVPSFEGVGEITGQINSGNASTWIANAAIGTAQVGTLTAQNLTVGALSNTVNGGATSGGRVEITSNRIQVFDGSNALRVRLGSLL